MAVVILFAILYNKRMFTICVLYSNEERFREEETAKDLITMIKTLRRMLRRWAIKLDISEEDLKDQSPLGISKLIQDRVMHLNQNDKLDDNVWSFSFQVIENLRLDAGIFRTEDILQLIDILLRSEKDRNEIREYWYTD
jgi:ATP-dependent Clp protease ATP-binding subunit ClpA